MSNTSIFNQILLGEFPYSKIPTPLERLNQNFINKIGQNEEAMYEIDQLCKNSTEKSGSILISSALDLKRIFAFKKYFDWTPLTRKEVANYTKNSKISRQLRESANQYFKKKNLKLALRGYNLAICYAPALQNENTMKISNPEELSLAFANRSAVFSEMGTSNANNCLRDINLALKLGYVENLKSKLEKRRAKCETILNNSAQEAHENRETKLRSEYCQNVLFKLKNPNKLISAAENFIEIQLDSEKGRKLVVMEDVRPGCVLLVESPFAKILKDGLKWDMEHCYHCHRRINGGTSCTGCVFATFCSDECRTNAATSYHQYECPCLPFLHLNKTPRYVMLVFRVITVLGPEELWRLYKSQDRQYFTVNPTGSGIEEINASLKIYSSTSYLPVYHLISHSQDLNEVEVFSNIMQALALANCLKHQAGFFNVKMAEDAQFLDFVASIILHHLQNIPYNSISTDELSGKFEHKFDNLDLDASAVQKLILDSQTIQFGAAIYPTASLINHSCDPNVTRVQDSNESGEMAIVALKTLKAGDEMLTSYSKVFTADSLTERREYLQSNFHFLCKCLACEGNWPIFQELQNLKPKFVCSNPKCVNKQVIGKNSICSSCRQKHSNKVSVVELEKYVRIVNECRELVLQNKPMESVAPLTSCMEYFDANVQSPFGETHVARDTLKKALDLIVFQSKCRQDVN